MRQMTCDAGHPARHEGEVALDAIDRAFGIDGVRPAERRLAGGGEAREIGGADAAPHRGFERIQEEGGRDALAAGVGVEARIGEDEAFLGGADGIEKEKALRFLGVDRGAEVGREGLALLVEQQGIGPDDAGERALDETGDEDEPEPQATRGGDGAHEHAALAERALAIDLGRQQLAHAGEELVARRWRRVTGERAEDAFETLAGQLRPRDPGRRGGRWLRRGTGSRCRWPVVFPGRRPVARRPAEGHRRGEGRGRPGTRGPRGPVLPS